MMHKIGREVTDFPMLTAPNEQNMLSKPSTAKCLIAINLSHATGPEPLPGQAHSGGYSPCGRMGVPDTIPRSHGSFHGHLFFWQQRRLKSLESSLKRRIVIVNDKQQQQYTFRESPKSITFNLEDNSHFLFLISQL